MPGEVEGGKVEASLLAKAKPPAPTARLPASSASIVVLIVFVMLTSVRADRP